MAGSRSHIRETGTLAGTPLLTVSLLPCLPALLFCHGEHHPLLLLGRGTFGRSFCSSAGCAARSGLLFRCGGSSGLFDGFPAAPFLPGGLSLLRFRLGGKLFPLSEQPGGGVLFWELFHRTVQLQQVALSGKGFLQLHLGQQGDAAQGGDDLSLRALVLALKNVAGVIAALRLRMVVVPLWQQVWNGHHT